MSTPLIELTLYGSQEWTHFAVCRDTPYLMYPRDEDSAGIELAKEVCATCPVRAECLDEAQRTGDRWGIWGGYTAEERRTMRRNAARRTAAPERQRKPVARRVPVANRPVTDVDTGGLL